MSEAPDLDIEPLKKWGFAPGNYWCNCSDCGKQHTADKRAWRCLTCAEKRAGLYDAQAKVIEELLDELDAVPVDFGHYEAAARTMRDIIQKARGELYGK